MLRLVISLIAFFLSVGHANGEGVNWQSQFYSQNVFDSRTDNFVSQNKLWLLSSRSQFVTPFVSIRVDQDLKTTAAEKFNENRAQPGIGLLFSGGASGLGAFLEILTGGQQATIYHSKIWFFPKDFGKFFLETYSDLSTRSSWSGNNIFAHWSRAGIRLGPNSVFTLDFYPELNFHKDTAGWGYENFSDLRIGARLNWAQPKFVRANLSVSNGTGFYSGDSQFLAGFKSVFVFEMDYSL